jgi:2-keto-3-deoxy-L-fuconate dehydrogenase
MNQLSNLIRDLAIEATGFDTVNRQGRRPRKPNPPREPLGDYGPAVNRKTRVLVKWSGQFRLRAVGYDRPSRLENGRHREDHVLAGRLQGKTALITAAGQGIGRATALAMAGEGAQVFATDVNAKLLEHLAGVANITVRTLDVLDDAAIAKTCADLPALSILFNCAGYVHHGTILDCTPKDWDFSFNLNVRAMYVTIKNALPKMLERGGGSIINMASVAGSLKGIPNRFVYGTSKAAVIGLTKAVAADFVTRNIRCNAIAPGTVDTPSLGDRINAFADPVEARKAFIARQPMGRLAKPEEIAPVVVFLASDESAFATGNVYSVDGGMTI